MEVQGHSEIMAAVPPGYWRCPNANCFLAVNHYQLKCPYCNTGKPVVFKEFNAFLTAPWMMSFSKPYILAGVPQCGTYQPRPKRLFFMQDLSCRQHYDEASTSEQQYRFNLECYFCGNSQDFTKSDDKHCKFCRKRQPKDEPKGPPCIHGCGVKLISPNARLCARCGKPQRHQARKVRRSQTGAPSPNKASLGHVKTSENSMVTASSVTVNNDGKPPLSKNGW